MPARTCPHDQTPLVEVHQLFFPLRVQPTEASRLEALFKPGAQPNPLVCPSCGYVGFYLQPDDLAALVSPKDS